MPSNMKLYISRVEIYHQKNFVSSTLQTIGRVSSIEYIERKDQNQKDYYSAIVTFQYWIMSEDTKNLFKELAESQKQVKFYYVDKKGIVRYWIIKEYLEVRETQELINESQNLELIYHQIRNTALERQLVELNSTTITQRLQIDYLNSRLDEAEIAKETVKIRDADLEYMQEENRKLREELELLRRDVRDRDRMIEYYETGH